MQHLGIEAYFLKVAYIHYIYLSQFATNELIQITPPFRGNCSLKNYIRAFKPQGLIRLNEL